MKKTLALFLATVLSLSLFGCGKPDKEEEEATDARWEENVKKIKEELEEKEKQDEESQKEYEEREKRNKELYAENMKTLEDAGFDIRGYDGNVWATVTLKSYSIINESYGSYSVVISADFTNKKEFDMSYKDCAIYVEPKLSYSEFDMGQDTKVKPGESTAFVFTVYVSKDKPNIEFKVSDETVYTLKTR